MTFMGCLLVPGKCDYNNVPTTAACRDARKWPFLSTSIWNTPIGSDAVFHDPGIFRPPFPLPNDFFSDDDYFIVTSSNDPPTPWYNQGWWGSPSGEAHCNITGNFVRNISFPANLTVTMFGNNNAAALLQPDNHSIINTQPLYRCKPGLPVLSILNSEVEGKDDILWGNGTWGQWAVLLRWYYSFRRVVVACTTNSACTEVAAVRLYLLLRPTTWLHVACIEL